MSRRDGGDLHDIGWRFDVDADADELRLEHVESGNAYRFDSAGNLHVPGDGDGGDVRELQATLAAALEADGDATQAHHGLQTQTCSVECDEQTGEVTIEADSKISLAAPQIELSGQGYVEVASSGQLTLRGALINLN